MNYEQKYKEALEKVKDMILFKQVRRDDMEDLFPELAESEDEKIRRELIAYFRNNSVSIKWSGLDVKKVIEWLEKQVPIDEDEIVEGIRRGIAISLINHIDANSKGMCLSNMECENIKNAIVNEDWDKVYGYMKKNLEKQGKQKYTQRDVDDAYLKGICDAKKELEKQGEQPSAIRWYDVSLIPQEMEELLVEWDSEDATWHEIAFYHADTKTFWNGTRQVENVTRWCYIIDLLENQGEQKSVDKIEPKFHECDWIVNNDSGGVYQVTEIRDDEYCLWPLLDTEIMGYLRIIDVDNDYHLWTIDDAKEGDVLACENGWTCIYKCLNDNLFSSHCFIDNEGWFCEEGGQAHTLDNEICGEIHPATKEQRDLLFKKIHEAGYEWDAEKKELKKIHNALEKCEIESIEHGKYYYCIKDYFSGGKKQASKGDVVQALRGLPIMGLKDASEYFLPVNFIKCNSAWSEEGEAKINRIVACLENLNVADNDILLKDVEWLKSLKDRVQPKQQWSEHRKLIKNDACVALTKKMLYDIILDLKVFRDKDCSAERKSAYQREIDWLENLKKELEE